MSGDSLSGRLRNAVTPAATVLPELPPELRAIVRQSVDAVVAIAREIEAEARSRKSGLGGESGAAPTARRGGRDTATGRFFEGRGDEPPTMECNASETDERVQGCKAVGFTISLLEPTGE